MKWNPEVEDGHFKQQNTRMGICLNNPCMVMSGMVLGCWGMNLPCNSNDLPSWGKLQGEDLQW